MRHIIKDSLVIILSLSAAIVISEAELVEKLLLVSENIRIAGSFIAGLFFTSVFTTAPSIAAFGEISQVEPLLRVAVPGALGALVGDLVIFYFFKNHVADDLNTLMHKMKRNPVGLFKSKSFRWVGVIVGALIIASPFPDELGIALLGISRVRFGIFIPVSLVFNFLGILFIGLAAQLLI